MQLLWVSSAQMELHGSISFSIWTLDWGGIIKASPKGREDDSDWNNEVNGGKIMAHVRSLSYGSLCLNPWFS